MQLNREKLADMFGCSLRTVDDYKNHGMPGEPPERAGDQWRFDSADCINWLVARERKSVEAKYSGGDQQGTLTFQRQRLTQGQADLVELERKKLEEALLDAEEVAQEWSSEITEARNILLAIGDELGDKIAAETDAVRCRELINARVRAALQELADAA